MTPQQEQAVAIRDLIQILQDSDNLMPTRKSIVDVLTQTQSALEQERKQHEIDNKGNQDWINSLCEELCKMEDVLGFKNDCYDKKGKWVPTIGPWLERVRDLLAAEGEVGDLKAALEQAQRERDEAVTALKCLQEQVGNTNRADTDYKKAYENEYVESQVLRKERDELQAKLANCEQQLEATANWHRVYKERSEELSATVAAREELICQKTGEIGKLQNEVDVLTQQEYAWSKEVEELQSKLLASEASRTMLCNLARQIEEHCPCGARPEDFNAYPHVSGCPVGAMVMEGASLKPIPEGQSWYPPDRKTRIAELEAQLKASEAAAAEMRKFIEQQPHRHTCHLNKSRPFSEERRKEFDAKGCDCGKDSALSTTCGQSILAELERLREVWRLGEKAYSNGWQTEEDWIAFRYAWEKAREVINSK